MSDYDKMAEMIIVDETGLKTGGRFVSFQRLPRIGEIVEDYDISTYRVIEVRHKLPSGTPYIYVKKYT